MTGGWASPWSTPGSFSCGSRESSPRALAAILAGLPPWLAIALTAIIPATVLVTFMAVGPIVYVYAETKIAGFMQDRIGPKRVGPYGLLQTVADAVKLLFKEAIYPAGVDKLPVHPRPVPGGRWARSSRSSWFPSARKLQTADLNVGVFYVVAVSSLSTVGLIMAGWASNNKYALFGAMRSAAQIVSYEIPAVMTLLIIVMIVGSLSLQDIVRPGRRLATLVPLPLLPADAHRLRHLLHRRARRVQPRALRHPRGRERARGRVPHRVQRLLLRDVLHGRVHRDVRDLGGGLGAVPRRVPDALPKLDSSSRSPARPSASGPSGSSPRPGSWSSS